MKTLLVIYPHWPPSNLGGSPPRAITGERDADLGWHPIVLTVHQDDYEEPPAPGSEVLGVP